MAFEYGGVDDTSYSKASSVTGWLAIGVLPISEVNATRNQLIWAMKLLSVIILLIMAVTVVSIICYTQNHEAPD